MRFSERIGKKPVKSLLQIDSIDSELQIRIWNIFVERLELITYYQHSASQRANICVEIWKDFFNYQLTSIPKTSFNYPHAPQMVEVFRKWFFSTAQWYEIYDFIEFVCNVPRNLDMLQLVFAYRNIMSIIQNNIGGHQYRVSK